MSDACQPSLWYAGSIDHARCAGRDDERRDAVVGAGRHRGQRRDVGAAVGDERLRAVDHPVVAVERRLGLGRPGVGSTVGFGEAEPTERATGDEIGEPLRLLIVVAELEDRVGAEADAGRQRDAHRLIDAAELLDRHAQRCEVAAGAAVLLGEDDPEQAEVAHLPHDVDREVVLDVPPGRVRCDLALGELAHHRAEHLVLLGQLPAHPFTLT